MPADVGYLQFGFEMGLGVRTYLTSASPWVLAAGLVLLPAPSLLILAASLGFALGRFLPVVVSGLGRESSLWVRVGLVLFSKRAGRFATVVFGVGGVAVGVGLMG